MKSTLRYTRQPRARSYSSTENTTEISTSTGTASSSRALCSSASWNTGSSHTSS